MKHKLLSLFPLILILVLAFYVRIYKLTEIPPSLFSDEVDAGYQAYIFNKCQTDYFGRKNPIHFKSNSDYRTPLLIYSISFSQKIFGINEFSTRFPSLVFGVLSIFYFYLIGTKVSSQKYTGLCLAFISAVNPWLIHYSRTAFEVSGMILSVLVSLYHFLNFHKSKQIKSFTLSIVFLIVSAYFYSTAKLYIILIGFTYLIISPNLLFSQKISKLFLALALSLICFLPLLISTLKGEAGYRFSYISIFTEPSIKSQIDYFRSLDTDIYQQNKIGTKTSLSSKIFHNKYSYIINLFINNYLSSFSPAFLFSTGDLNLRQGFGKHGYFYHIDFILLIIGLVTSLFKKNKVNLFFSLLLIISPIPFSLTRDSTGPHATRLILLSIPIIFFISKGILNILSSHFLRTIFLFVYVFSFLNFFHFYTHDYSHLSAKAWHSGMKQAISLVEKYQKDYDQVYFNNSFEPPLPFYLFYTKYFNKEAQCNIYGNIPWTSVPHFTGYQLDNKFYLGHMEWSSVKNVISTNKILFVATQDEMIPISSNISPHQLVIIDKTEKLYETEPQFFLFTI